MFLSRVEGSPSLEVVNLVLDKRSKGEKVISLAIGDPSSQTPKEIIDAATEAMIKGDVHYVPAAGTPRVREAIRRKVWRRNEINAGMEDICFLTTKLSVFASLMAISNDDEHSEVLVPNPGYFYTEPVVLSGAKPVAYRLRADDYRLDMNEIRSRATARTRAIFVNSPSNPTGSVLHKNELSELLQFCQERHIHILADEAYEDLTYDGAKHFAVGSLERSPEVVVSMFSLSKSYSMTGWRAGYVVANARIIQLISKFLENTITCLPPFIQEASAYALDNGDNFIEKFREEYSEKRKIVLEILEGIPGLESNKIQGAFYAFPQIRSGEQSTVYAKRLLQEENVAVLPGFAFGAAGEGRIRISFSGPREELEEGLKRIRSFMARNRVR
jgi:aspartate aminotransferase